MTKTYLKRIQNESTLLTCREMLEEDEKQLAWLKSSENTEESNRDFEYTERDIEFLEGEIRELKAEIARLEAWFEKHPTPPSEENHEWHSGS